MVPGAFTVPWPTPLLEGRLVRRYERFLVDVKLGRRVVRAHCVNPGRMEGMVVPGARVFLSEAVNPNRALRFTWELIELDGRLIGANTALPNTLVRQLLEARVLAGFQDVTVVKPEQVFGRGHRADFRLDTPAGTHWVEVKNCHLVYPDGRGYFPDSASDRARQHVDALARRVAAGDRATVLFTLQRDDAIGLRPSALHAPAFARSVWRAARHGVTFRALTFAPSLEGMALLGEVPVDTGRYDPKSLQAWSMALDATSGWLRKDGRVAGRSVVVDADA
jgi:sugar fermentation stimulation protein A